MATYIRVHMGQKVEVCGLVLLELELELELAESE